MKVCRVKVLRYVSTFASLLMEGGGRIKVCVYRKGEYDAPGFWDPERRLLGIEEPEVYDGRTLEAIVAHEVGHIRFTDVSMKGLRDGEKLVLNILEDVRVEKRMCGLFPGISGKVLSLRKKIYQDAPGDAPYSALLKVASHVLLWGRNLTDELSLGRFYGKRAGEAVSDFNDASDSAIRASSAGEVLKIAKELYEKWFKGLEKESKKKASALAEDRKRAGKAIRNDLEKYSDPGKLEKEEVKFDPLEEYLRSPSDPGGGIWEDKFFPAPVRDLKSPLALRLLEFLSSSAKQERTVMDVTGRLDVRSYVRARAAGIPSLEVFKSKESSVSSGMKLLVIVDTSGSMSGDPLDNSCRIARALMGLEGTVPGVKVRVVFTNHDCIEPLVLKDYGEPVSCVMEDLLRKVRGSSAEGLRTADMLLENPAPDLVLFLTDSCVDTEDVRWLGAVRRKLPVRAVYCGGALSSPEPLKDNFGDYGYVFKKTVEEVAPHLIRLLTTYVA